MPEQSRKVRRTDRREVAREATAPENLPPIASQPGYYERQEIVEWRWHIPPPQVLRAYDFITDGPERLLRMAEEQAKHRRKLENRQSWSETIQRVTGTLAPPLIALVGIVMSGYLIMNGKNVGGLVAILGSLATVLLAVQGARKAQRQQATDSRSEAQLELPIQTSEK